MLMSYLLLINHCNINVAVVAQNDYDEVTLIRSNCGQERNKNDKPTKNIVPPPRHAPCPESTKCGDNAHHLEHQDRGRYGSRRFRGHRTFHTPGAQKSLT